MRRRPTLVRLLCAGTVLIAPTALAQQFVEESGTRFPVDPENYSNQATLGDFDGDDDLDIIFANGGGFSSPTTPQRIRVLVNDGSGFFADESNTRLNFGGRTRGAEMGDIDGDGDLDVILAQDFNAQPQLYVNDGTGVFTNATGQLPTMLMSSSRAQFGDIDNDGDLDLYITNGGSTNRFGCGQYQVWVNDGAGNFTNETASRHPIGLICDNMDCIFGDVDGDFDLDVKTASTGSNNSRLFINDGNGVFTLDNTVPSDSSCYSYDFGDIDGDGDLDLLGANAGSGSSEKLMENDGNGNFTDISNQISPNTSLDDNDTKFFDVDDDGDLDYITARIGGPERVYINDGSGNFTQNVAIIENVGSSALDVMVGDLDSDGDFDVVTAVGESGEFHNKIYINNGPPDTRAPRIIDTEQLADTDDTTGPYVVRSAILDDMTSDRNFFDKGIDLNYTVGAGPAQSVPMKYSGGQIYRGELPGQAGGGVISYWVTATDWNNNTGTGDTLMFTVEGDGILGDLNGDGVVDTLDFLQLLAEWGPCDKPCPPSCVADLNADCQVDTQDFLILLANWTL